jgi:hypothetical protein
MFGLDRDQFHAERAVTCYTCHHGSVKPVSIPIVDSRAAYVSEARSAADPAVAGQTNLPSAGEVIDKYIEAVEALRRLRMCRAESKAVRSLSATGLSFLLKFSSNHRRDKR